MWSQKTEHGHRRQNGPAGERTPRTHPLRENVCVRWQVTERGLENVSTNDSPIYTLFDAETVEELTREHILRLAVGVLGAVHIKNFSSPDDCTDIMKGLEACPLGAYDEALIYPRIAKLGPAAYDFYASGGLDERYWSNPSGPSRRGRRCCAVEIRWSSRLGESGPRGETTWSPRAPAAGTCSPG